MNQKTTFLHQNKPLITCMVQSETPAYMETLIRNAAFDGCDAYGFQYERLDTQYHNAETVRSLFDMMGRKPIYATNYRICTNEGKSDEELAEGMLWLLEQGATLIDVIGDLYCPTQYEITQDAEAIKKQMKLIDTIHERGGEVLMSSHTLTFMSTEEVLSIARAHQARGADISKIVTAANTEEEEMENLKTTEVLRRELEIPFLFLSGGTHTKLHRTIGPFLGACMWLTVQNHDHISTRQQPVCRAIRAIADHFDY